MHKNDVEEGRTSELATFSKPVPAEQAGIITQGHPGKDRANRVTENRPAPDQNIQIAQPVELHWLPLRDTVL